MPNADAIAGGTATALTVALTMLGLFISGKIVRGQLVTDLLSSNEKLRATLGEMKDAFDRRNDIDEERLRVEREFGEDRRRGPRPRGA